MGEIEVNFAQRCNRKLIGTTSDGAADHIFDVA
jgi:hypothetical protein